MRLVGASTLYIALPFLLEALVTALIGVALAAGALGGVHVVRRRTQRMRDLVGFMPWIGVERATRTPWSVVAILGPVLTLIPTLAADPQIPQSLIRGPLPSRSSDCYFPEPRRQTRCAPSPVPRANAWPGGRRGLRSWRLGALTAPSRTPTADDLKDSRSRSRPRSSTATQRRSTSPAAGCSRRRGRSRRQAQSRARHAARAALRGRAGQAAGRPRCATRRCRTSWPRRRGAPRARRRPTWRRRRPRSPTSASSVTDTVVDIYEQGDPQLLGVADAPRRPRPPADLTRQEELRRTSSSAAEAQAYDDLHAAEVLLQVREDQVQDAGDEVADAARRPAAEHLVDDGAGSSDRGAADDARRTTGDVVHGRDARGRAAAADAPGARTSPSSRRLKKQENQIKQQIIAAAAARPQRAATAARPTAS